MIFFFILATVLFIVTISLILIYGKTVDIEYIYRGTVNSVDDIPIENTSDDPKVRCIKKSLDNGILKLRFEGIKPGSEIIYIDNDGEYAYFGAVFYVHKSGIVTYTDFFGNTTCDIVIPISIMILLSYLLFVYIQLYRHSVKKNMYQYKNIGYFGLIFFLSVYLIEQFFTIFNYGGLIYTVKTTLSVAESLSGILLPIAFVVSILVTISNIKLVKKEGKHWTNLLGVFLGGFICFMTLFPILLGEFLQRTTIIDVHNQNGWAYYTELIVENTIFVIVAYLECELLATIVISRKAAKHIPKFDKDFIILHGCQIKKDGTLTNLLKGRADKAIEFAKLQKEKTGKDLVFVPSGGKGDDELISEGEAIKNYLIKQGINESQILLEDKSTSTYENFKFSSELIKSVKEDAKVAFATTNYHVFRAGNIAYNMGIDVEGIGSSTKAYFWINAFIREFIATLVLGKKKHLLIILFLIIIMLFMIGIIYLSNNSGLLLKG